MFFGTCPRTVGAVTAAAAASPLIPFPEAVPAGQTGVPGLALFQRLLLETDGTVTQLLEAITGEPIEAVKLHQTFARTLRAGSGLDVAKGTPVLRRQVLLRGTTTGQVLLHATASVAVHRLPRPVLDGMLMTSEPIGRLLVASRVETFREILKSGTEAAGTTSVHLGLTPDDEIVFRTYRIVRGGRPLMVITERLPARPQR